MKVIEGFHIKKVKNGTKKGQDYISYSKRYFWKIPERLEGQIDKGDIVWVRAKIKDKDFKSKVLVVDIVENNEKALRSVINVQKKFKNEK